jgi:hypothetical protein
MITAQTGMDVTPMSIKTKQNAMVAGSAAAISAIGVLTGSAIAQARPPIPLAPTCSFNGTYVLNQSNGFRVEFPWNGAAPSGTAIAYGNDQQPKLTGPVSGGITSANEVAVTIDWAGPSHGQYVGALDAGGNVRGGFNQDIGGSGNTASWDSVTPLKCVEAPAPAPPQKPPPPAEIPKPPDEKPIPAAPTATVTSDVDQYSGPNGEGDVIGILRVGDVLKVVAPCPADGWCNFTDGTSAWGEFLKNN